MEWPLFTCPINFCLAKNTRHIMRPLRKDNAMNIIAIICALIGGAAFGWIAAAAWFSSKLRKQEMRHALELTNRFYEDDDDRDLPDDEAPLNEREQEIHDRMFGKL